MNREQRWKRRPEVSLPISRSRVFAVFSSFVILSVFIIFRLVEVQLVRHNEFSTRADRQYKNRHTIDPNRGRILDRRGNDLVINIANLYSIGVKTSKIKNRNELERELSVILGIPRKEIRQKLSSSKAFTWIVRKADFNVAKQVRALRDQSIVLQKETKREYPYEKVGGQVIGFVNTDNEGQGGIELTYDRILKGEPGWEILQQYGKNRQIVDESYPCNPAIDGGTIVLSIDINAQAIAEEELEKAVKISDAIGGSIVVTRPSTGEILAIASVPGFDPNDITKSQMINRQNQAVTSVYEPGSTFKVVPFTGLFEEGLLSIDELIDCEKGRYQVADRVIRDTHENDILTARQVLTKSSNIGTVKLVERLNPHQFYTLIRDFGFDQYTGVPLNGETKGLLSEPSKWSGVSQANLAIGHGIGVTSLQTAMAFGAIANGGFLMKPMLVLSTKTPEGQTELIEPEMVRRVMRPSTARAMRLLLGDAVATGTGTLASIDNINVSGKTGTAQKVDHENHSYYQDRFVSSFVGFLPTEQPELLCLVVIDDPQGDYYGGLVAAPVFRRVMERLLVTLPPQDYLFVQEDQEYEYEYPENACVVPSLVTLPKVQVASILEKLNLVPVWTGEGEMVISQGTPPGTKVMFGSGLELVLGEYTTHSGKVIVPDLAGMDLREAIAMLSGLGLSVKINGVGKVSSQAPEAGSSLKVGQTCTIFAEAGVRRAS